MDNPSGDNRRLTEEEYREMNLIARYSASFPIRSLPAAYRIGGAKYQRYQELDRKLFPGARRPMTGDEAEAAGAAEYRRVTGECGTSQ